MNAIFCLSVISAIAQAILAIIVLLRNSKKIENRIFSVLLLLFMLWSIMEAIIIYSGANELLIKLMFTPAIVLTYVFCLFSAYFPNLQSNSIILKKKQNPYLFFIPVIILIYLLWSGNIFKTHDFYKTGIVFTFAKTEFFIKGILVSYLLLSLFTLSKSTQEAQTVTQKRRLRYTFFAMLLPIAAGSIVTALSKYFLPAGTMYMYGMFPILGIIMSTILTYTMLKYNLMGIDIIFSIGLLYTSTSVALAACMEIIQELMENLFNSSDTLSQIITVLFVAAVFTPIKNLFEKLINIFFGHKSFDSAQVMQKTLDKLRTQTNSERLINCFITELEYITGSDKIELIKANENQEIEIPLLPPNLNDIDEIVFHFNAIQDEENEKKAILLKDKDIKLYYSFNVSGKHYGNLLIGAKKSKVPYTETETNLIQGLINEFPHILENLEMIQTILKQEKAAQATQIAAKMLNDIATKPGIAEVDKYRIASFTSLAPDIKGDMLDICKDNSNTFISLYDAVHDGIKAVLTLNMVYTIFHSIESIDEKVKRCSELLKSFVEQNLSFAFTTLTFKDDSIQITNFGNPNPIIISKDSINTIDMPVKAHIGIETNLKNTPHTVKLKKEDIMLCSTKGLYKAFKEIKGITLEEFLRSKKFVSVEDCRNQITETVYHRLSEGFTDDTTFIVVGLK